MKNTILTLVFILFAITSFADGLQTIKAPADTVKILYDGTHVYYQKVINVDTISESSMYVSAIQFMAAKNFTQNYGDEEEGKLIFTTSQDLNLYGNYVPTFFSVQFAITLDLKNGRYRYTINSATFFYSNSRFSFYDMYARAANVQSKQAYIFGKSVLSSFNDYLNSLLNELNEDITHKSVTSDSKF